MLLNFYILIFKGYLVTSKTYVQIITFTIIAFALFHIIVWFSLTSKFFQVDNNLTVGDLARLSYSEEILLLKKNESNLPHKHFDYSALKPVDIITIGDSFSQGGGHGENSYYQDFIASNQNLNVLNIRALPQKGIFETVLILHNSGLLKKLKPRAIIVESAERYSIRRFTKKFNWKENREINEIEAGILKTIEKHKAVPPNELSIINKLNYKSIIYNMLYNFDDNAYLSKVYITSLNTPLFTGDCADCLYFYSEDIENMQLTNNSTINKLNQNLNQLQKILIPDEIDLYFMPVVDKYNLYSKYITNNKYGKSSFFELLREKDKIYKFIDTKKRLRALTENKTKNVYHPDDTHWSSIASKHIFKGITF